MSRRWKTDKGNSGENLGRDFAMRIKDLELPIEDIDGKDICGGMGQMTGMPDWVATWHGHGSDHQANNSPGDTAADRHGFANAQTPGGINPTGGRQ